MELWATVAGSITAVMALISLGLHNISIPQDGPRLLPVLDVGTAIVAVVAAALGLISTMHGQAGPIWLSALVTIGLAVAALVLSALAVKGHREWVARKAAARVVTTSDVD